MKTKEELNAIKEEVEAVNKKLAELTDDELAQVMGGEGETTIQLGMMQPGMMQPGMMQPGMMQPGMMQPGRVDPNNPKMRIP